MGQRGCASDEDEPHRKEVERNLGDAEMADRWLKISTRGARSRARRAREPRRRRFRAYAAPSPSPRIARTAPTTSHWHRAWSRSRWPPSSTAMRRSWLLPLGGQDQHRQRLCVGLAAQFAEHVEAASPGSMTSSTRTRGRRRRTPSSAGLRVGDGVDRPAGPSQDEVERFQNARLILAKRMSMPNAPPRCFETGLPSGFRCDTKSQITPRRQAKCGRTRGDRSSARRAGSQRLLLPAGAVGRGQSRPLVRPAYRLRDRRGRGRARKRSGRQWSTSQASMNRDHHRRFAEGGALRRCTCAPRTVPRAVGKTARPDAAACPACGTHHIWPRAGRQWPEFGRAGPARKCLVRRPAGSERRKPKGCPPRPCGAESPTDVPPAHSWPRSSTEMVDVIGTASARPGTRRRERPPHRQGRCPGPAARDARPCRCAAPPRPAPLDGCRHRQLREQPRQLELPCRQRRRALEPHQLLGRVVAVLAGKGMSIDHRPPPTTGC